MEKHEEGSMGVKMEWLSCIDATTLSQSELHALSLSSLPPSFDPIITPIIDPTFFNESSGTHRQTYAAPRQRRRCRVSALLPSSTPSSDHPRIIVDFLKQLIMEDPRFDQVELLQQPRTVPEPPIGERKRKRGRKPKERVQLEESFGGMETVNKNGVAVDFSALANADSPFAEELARRTEGLQGEEELLGFLRDLAGQWGSRRKKRRIVDAADFGDALPLGWKLLLGLKRKEGRAWIYCRRYISPSGQQFVSCKEVSSYLQSLFGHGEPQLQVSCRSENKLQEQRVTTENSAGVTGEDQDQRQITATNSDVPGLSVSNERVKEVALLGVENLADVQIHDLFECHKCSMTFDEKDSYLQHLLSVHQRTTRRYRLGSSVGDGVIIKDGKFECQFCHKVFLERRRYNGHVGIHVRNYVRGVDDSPGQANVQREDKSPVLEEIPLRISKMDALVEIAQNSIMEDSVMEPHNSAKPNMIPTSEIAVGDFGQDMNFAYPTNAVDDLNLQCSTHLPVDGKGEEIDDDNQVIDANVGTFMDSMGLSYVNKKSVNVSGTSKGKEDVALTSARFDQSGIDLEGVSQSPLFPLSSCTNSKGQFELDEDNSKLSELKFSLDGCKDVPVRADFQEIVMPASEETVVHSSISNRSISTEHPLGCFPAFSSDKV